MEIHLDKVRVRAKGMLDVLDHLEKDVLTAL